MSVIFDIPMIKSIAGQVVRGMAELHSFGVIHRDLKPANILLKKKSLNTNDFIVKISDFGLIRRDSDDTMRKTAIGTKIYLPPELRDIVGQKSDLVSTKTDVYSFGVTLWEMLTRKRAYMTVTGSGTASSSNVSTAFGASPVITENEKDEKGNQPIEYEKLPLENIPTQFINLLQRCLASNPQQRPDFTTIMTSL